MKRCKYCVNRITDNSGASYCKMQKSSRTYNGLKPVKASSMACVMYKRKDMTKEETMEEKLCIGLFPVSNGRKEIIPCDGYEVVVENGKTYVVKKKPQYPKTYEECCNVLMGKTNFQDFSLVLTKLSTNINEENSISPEPPYISLINKFYKLLICRDAYWKIAGEEIWLDKPWEPDWTDLTQKYCILCRKGKVDTLEAIYANKILAFPTMEMRDAFYENFKDLINDCKELL